MPQAEADPARRLDREHRHGIGLCVLVLSLLRLRVPLPEADVAPRAGGAVPAAALPVDVLAGNTAVVRMATSALGENRRLHVAHFLLRLPAPEAQVALGAALAITAATSLLHVTASPSASEGVADGARGEAADGLLVGVACIAGCRRARDRRTGVGSPTKPKRQREARRRRRRPSRRGR